MESQFLFVDATKNDRQSKRLARSHAMKGKNAGKKLHRRSRLTLTERPQAPIQTMPADDNDAIYQHLEPLYSSPDNDIKLSPFPSTCGPNGGRIIKQFFDFSYNGIFPSQICIPSNRMASYWTKMLFFDETSFHCIIAMMETMNAFFLNQKQLSYQTSTHLDHAIRNVRARLTDSDILQESSFMVVNFMLVQSLVQESRQGAKFHRHGLERMISLGGGLCGLDIGYTLLIKICRTDIDFVLHYGGNTNYYRDHMADVKAIIVPCHDSCPLLSQPRCPAFASIDSELAQILRDTMAVVSYLNNGIGEYHRLEPHIFSEFIISVGCRMLAFKCLEDGAQLPATERAYHIGLATLLSTLYIQYGDRRYLKYNMVENCLRATIVECFDVIDSKIVLWLILIGGPSVLADSEDRWLLSRLRVVVSNSSVNNWEDVRNLLRDFPWIAALHDEPAEALYDRVRQGQSDFMIGVADLTSEIYSQKADLSMSRHPPHSIFSPKTIDSAAICLYAKRSTNERFWT